MSQKPTCDGSVSINNKCKYDVVYIRNSYATPQKHDKSFILTQPSSPATRKAC